jgi:hypothetical protein
MTQLLLEDKLTMCSVENTAYIYKMKDQILEGLADLPDFVK